MVLVDVADCAAVGDDIPLETPLAAEDLLPLDSRWRGATEVSDEVRPLREVMREAEIAHLRSALVLTGGHRTQTAELLGISRKVLWEKLRDFGIEAPNRGKSDD